MTAAVKLVRSPAKARWHQMSIVKAVFQVEHCRVPRGAFEMLEPDVGKLASPVLRGPGGGNIARLPDCNDLNPR